MKRMTELIPLIQDEKFTNVIRPCGLKINELVKHTISAKIDRNIRTKLAVYRKHLWVNASVKNV